MTFSKFTKICRWIFSRTLTAKFVTMALIVSVVSLGVMIWANVSMQSRQSEIIGSYKENQEAINALLDQERKLLLDSVFSPQQKIAIFEHLQEQVDEVQGKANIDRIESLLSLEFNKIQGEYEVLNLWCALLTVVFLIFSFYSVIRSNEIHTQAQTALKSLKRTEIEAQAKSASIDDAVTKAEERVKNVLKGYSDTAKKHLEMLQNNLSPIQAKQEAINEQIDKVSDMADNLEGQVLNSKSELSAILLDQIKTSEEELNRILNNAELDFKYKYGDKIEQLRQQISSLEYKVNHINDPEAQEFEEPARDSVSPDLPEPPISGSQTDSDEEVENEEEV